MNHERAGSRRAAAPLLARGDDGQGVPLIRLCDALEQVAAGRLCLVGEARELLASAVEAGKVVAYLVQGSDAYAVPVDGGVKVGTVKPAAAPTGGGALELNWIFSDDEWGSGLGPASSLWRAPAPVELHGPAGVAHIVRTATERALGSRFADAWLLAFRGADVESLAVREVTNTAGQAAPAAGRPITWNRPDTRVPVVQLAAVDSTDIRQAREAMARAEFKPNRAKHDLWTVAHWRELLRQFDALTAAGPGKMKAEAAHALLGELWGGYSATSIKTFLTQSRIQLKTPARRAGA